MQPETPSDALRRLSNSGFTHTLRAEHGRSIDLATGETYDPELLEIAEVVRFEGESDPDEQVVPVALRSTREAPLGTYTVVFGAAMPPNDADVVRRFGGRI